MKASGWTAVEAAVGLSVFGALLAIGVPGYVGYSEHGREAQCASNRHAIEAAERACALDNKGTPCLAARKLATSGYLGTMPTCGSGGKYVWIVSDAADPEYPKIGCSKHFFPAAKAGSKR